MQITPERLDVEYLRRKAADMGTVQMPQTTLHLVVRRSMSNSSTSPSHSARSSSDEIRIPRLDLPVEGETYVPPLIDLQTDSEPGDPEPEPDPKPPKNRFPHLAVLSQFRISSGNPGQLFISLVAPSSSSHRHTNSSQRSLDVPARAHICAGAGHGLSIGVSLDKGLLSYRDWSDLVDGGPKQRACRWLMATREGNLVLSFFMGPVLTALAWAPFVGNAGGEGVCVWGEEEPPKDPDPDPKKPLMY